MTRLAFLAAAAMSTALVAGTGIASAETEDAAPAEPFCTFTLSAPQRQENGNTYAVTASMRAQACNGKSNARRSIVCLSTDGGPETCSEGLGWGVARIAVPWIPGRTYTVTGRGCADPGIPFPVTTCTPSGPFSASL